MLNYIKAQDSIRVDGMLRLRVRELAQREDGQWFIRVDKSAWDPCTVEFVHETSPKFWIIKIDGKTLDGAQRLLPASVFPKLRLSK